MISRILPNDIIILGDFSGKQTAVSEWGARVGVDIFVTRFGVAITTTHLGSEDIVVEKLKSTAPEFVRSISRSTWKQYGWSTPIV